jgi:hypothetical protein
LATLFFLFQRPPLLKKRRLPSHPCREDAGERPHIKGGLLVQASTVFIAIAAIPRTIPIIPEIPILPVAFLNRNVPAQPSRMATMARITVRIPHERMPKTRLTIPSQFLVRFGAAAGACTGTAAAKGTWTGTVGAGAG